MAKSNTAPAAERIPFKLGTPIFFDGVEIETLLYRRIVQRWPGGA